MILVSNTGPIIALAKADQLPLLPKLAERVLIPPRVQRELLAKLDADADAIDRALQQFVEVQPPAPVAPDASTVLRPLDDGERQAIELALGLPVSAVVLLLDDQAGRTAARLLNLTVTGTIGILLRAKELGLLSQITPPLQQMRENGYWLSDELLAAARQLADE